MGGAKFLEAICCFRIASAITKKRIYCVLITFVAMFWLMICCHEKSLRCAIAGAFRGWPFVVKRDVDVLILLHFKTSTVVFLCWILKLLLLSVYYSFAWDMYDSLIEVAVIFSIVKRVLSLLLLRMNISYCLTLQNLNTQRILNLPSLIYINYAYMVIINI